MKGTTGSDGSRWYEGEERDTPSGWMAERRRARPTRSRDGRTHHEPAREVPVHHETDVACDPSTQSFMREIPQCWLTGQAAGVAAALAVRDGPPPRAVDVHELQSTLRGQGVWLTESGKAVHT